MTDKIDAWKALASREMKGGDPDSLTWESPEGIPIKPLYTEADTAGLGHLGTIPGQAPYVRGPKATMYAGRPWTIRQYAGFSTAEESNAFYRKALEGGAQGCSVAFDLATHRGYDSRPPARGWRCGQGRRGNRQCRGHEDPVRWHPAGSGQRFHDHERRGDPGAGVVHRGGEEQGVERAKLSGTIQNDILKEFMVRNTYIYPPAPSMRIVSDIIAYTAAEMPKFNSISISGYHMQEAGANLVQELAFTLADGKEYVKAALSRGHGRGRLRPGCRSSSASA